MKRRMQTEAEIAADARADLSQANYVMGLVSVVAGVPLSDMRALDRKDARTSRARQLCMYLISVAWQWPLHRIGAAFGRNRTTVGHACRRIEDLRDNRLLDEQIERLEACLLDMPSGLALPPRKAA